MQVVILCSEEQKGELLSSGTSNNAQIIWVAELMEFAQYQNANVFIDLLFESTKERILFLNELLPAIIVINSVVETLSEVNNSFIRINGWSTFLSSNIIEAAGFEEERKSISEEAFALFGKSIEWLPDVPGFITPRIISAIINEAFFALADGVSTKEEIDTAMKLGTAYPYGPLEWGAKIGLQNIVTLLQKLALTQHRYTPAELMMQETNRSI